MQPLAFNSVNCFQVDIDTYTLPNHLVDDDQQTDETFDFGKNLDVMHPPEEVEYTHPTILEQKKLLHVNSQKNVRIDYTIGIQTMRLVNDLIYDKWGFEYEQYNEGELDEGAEQIYSKKDDSQSEWRDDFKVDENASPCVRNDFNMSIQTMKLVNNLIQDEWGFEREEYDEDEMDEGADQMYCKNLQQIQDDEEEDGTESRCEEFLLGMPEPSVEDISPFTTKENQREFSDDDPDKIVKIDYTIGIQKMKLVKNLMYDEWGFEREEFGEYEMVEEDQIQCNKDDLQWIKDDDEEGDETRSGCFLVGYQNKVMNINYTNDIQTMKLINNLMYDEWGFEREEYFEDEMDVEQMYVNKVDKLKIKGNYDGVNGNEICCDNSQLIMQELAKKSVTSTQYDTQEYP